MIKRFLYNLVKLIVQIFVGFCTFITAIWLLTYHLRLTCIIGIIFMCILLVFMVWVNTCEEMRKEEQRKEGGRNE